MKTILLISLLFSVSSAFAKSNLSLIFEPSAGYEVFKYDLQEGSQGNEVDVTYEKSGPAIGIKLGARLSFFELFINASYMPDIKMKSKGVELNQLLDKISSTRAAINIGFRGERFRLFGGYIFNHKYSYENENVFQILHANGTGSVFKDFKGYNIGLSVFFSKIVFNLEFSSSQTKGSWGSEDREPSCFKCGFTRASFGYSF